MTRAAWLRVSLSIGAAGLLFATLSVSADDGDPTMILERLARLERAVLGGAASEDVSDPDEPTILALPIIRVARIEVVAKDGSLVGHIDESGVYFGAGGELWADGLIRGGQIELYGSDDTSRASINALGISYENSAIVSLPGRSVVTVGTACPNSEPEEQASGKVRITDVGMEFIDTEGSVRVVIGSSRPAGILVRDASGDVVGAMVSVSDIEPEEEDRGAGGR